MKFKLNIQSQRKTHVIFVRLDTKYFNKIKNLAKSNNMAMQSISSQMIEHCLNDIDNNINEI